MKKKISIITINYNNLAGLKKTGSTIIPQLSDSVEWIIIDGGSTDGCLKYIQENIIYLSYWCTEKDNGIYDAMNKGINASTGEYIYFVNSGDFLIDKSIEKILNFVNEKKYKVIYGSGYYLFKNNIKIYRRFNTTSNFLHGLPALHQATIYSREKIPPAGYNLEYRLAGDFWLANYLHKQDGETGYINDALAVHPIHGGAAISNSLEVVIEAYKIQKEFFPHNSVKRTASVFLRLVKIAIAKLLSSRE